VSYRACGAVCMRPSCSCCSHSSRRRKL
jgi:hypothetical protein